MSSEARLAEIHGKLVEAGIPNLVMGGHAVRFHGVERITVDELLEEILDERRLAAATTEEGKLEFLGDLRSRRGFEAGVRAGLFRNPGMVALAWSSAIHPVARAFLAPSLPEGMEIGATSGSMVGEILSRLRTLRPASARHLALVEAVRRLRKREAMEADRRDKLGSAR